MIGRIIWIAGLLAIAGLTTALQIDRQSARDPALTTLVPAPLRNDAQVQIAAAALAAGKTDTALAEAERLVRRRPVPAEHLSLLAAAQARSGAIDQAEMTIQIAAQRGWREPLAQESVLRMALDAGDAPEAARRYAALFRREATPDALLVTLGPAVMGSANSAGRTTFAGIIAGAERWQTMYLQRGLQVMPADAFAEVTARAIAGGAQFDCTALTPAFESLRQRDPAAAQQLAAPAARACP
jgi:hypothetical protein